VIAVHPSVTGCTLSCTSPQICEANARKSKDILAYVIYMLAYIIATNKSISNGDGCKNTAQFQSSDQSHGHYLRPSMAGIIAMDLDIISEFSV